jgi:hypothetical protein
MGTSPPTTILQDTKVYEIKSCGTTIDLVSDHYSAIGIYDRCVSCHVQLFRYNGDGNKYLVAERRSNLNVVTRKQQ